MISEGDMPWQGNALDARSGTFGNAELQQKYGIKKN